MNGKILIQEETTKHPLQLIGKEAGVCWGADVTNEEKNYKRAINCIESGHGRLLEYPQIYVVIDGYSARVIRELYTHIGGAPTRLQESTRYVDCNNFDYVCPPSIRGNDYAFRIYEDAMRHIMQAYKDLDEIGYPREDIANLLPLGMTTKIVLRTNLRQLLDMSHQRLCSRAYWEFRDLMRQLGNELSNYSEEWATIINNYYKAKCEVTGYCTEQKSCGRYPKKNV